MLQIEKSEDNELSVSHQYGKLIFATTFGFLASKAAEKVYDVVLEIYRQRASKK